MATPGVSWGKAGALMLAAMTLGAQQKAQDKPIPAASSSAAKTTPADPSYVIGPQGCARHQRMERRSGMARRQDFFAPTERRAGGRADTRAVGCYLDRQGLAR
jgi:hypothetical protein